QRCLRDLGAELIPEGPHLRVQGFGRQPKPITQLNPGNAGAVLRFLIGVTAALLPEITFVTDYAQSLGKRPQDDLLTALEALGARIESRDGKLPIRIQGANLRGGVVEVSGAISSQFTSALLFAAPLIGQDLEIRVTGEIVSQPPLKQTLQVMRQAGITVEAEPEGRWYKIPGGQSYQPRTYSVPGDYPGSAALMAAAAILPSDVTIERLYEDEQGERDAISVLQAMGADLVHDGQRVRIRGGRPLKGGSFDGDRFTDAVLALTAAALYAEGRTEFYNVANLRVKECDRITDYRAELNKLGARVTERPDALIIDGVASLHGGVEANARIDHRVIMGLTVATLRAEAPVVIRDAHHIAKSYPAFFDHLRALGARIEEL
ncbi:MAG TPA: 3-phosphoshikimate 1-carboxyvinyltransferase, partial [Symbiobacteriaceae bacterium]|nr:3-phosphoshikimate 1-carboxyvinyltransferase [Symbiobacteriaceae bacterium]